LIRLGIAYLPRQAIAAGQAAVFPLAPECRGITYQAYTALVVLITFYTTAKLIADQSKTTNDFLGFCGASRLTATGRQITDFAGITVLVAATPKIFDTDQVQGVTAFIFGATGIVNAGRDFGSSLAETLHAKRSQLAIIVDNTFIPNAWTKTA
jgi:hypothetical protein